MGFDSRLPPIHPQCQAAYVFAGFVLSLAEPVSYNLLTTGKCLLDLAHYYALTSNLVLGKVPAATLQRRKMIYQMPIFVGLTLDKQVVFSEQGSKNIGTQSGSNLALQCMHCRLYWVMWACALPL